jgi:hypothetical protein
VKLFQCWHFCRNVNGAPGHDWSHEIKDGGVALDNFRLYCPDHSEAALQILEGMINDTSAGTSSGPQRRKSCAEESQSDVAEMPEGWFSHDPEIFSENSDSVGTLRCALSLALEAQADHDEMQVL